MSVKNCLTNEKLNERFDNAFSVVSHAIALARGLVRGGGEFEANAATKILDGMVDNNKEVVDEEEEDDTL